MIDLTDLPRGLHQPKTRAPRSNWADPVRWALIAAAGRLTGYRAQAIVNELKRGLNGIVGAWIKPDHSGWTQQALDRAARAVSVNSAHEAPRVAREGVKLGRPSLLVRIDTHIPAESC